MSETTVRDYLGKVERDFKRGIATEHSYRGALKDLLETLTGNVSATNEPKRIQCGAPDYVIERSRGTNTFTVGYVEAKDAGMSLEEIERDSKLNEPKTREGKQLKRYLHALDNLVFTNYLEFRWYLHGEKRAAAILAMPQLDKRLPFDREKAQEVARLLQNFLEHSAEPIRNPPELAKRMARVAHMIRDIIVEAFEQKAASSVLKDLYSAFKEVLLPELTGPEFADMFAQTLAYGLFAARYNHKGAKPFNRYDAAKEIPRTNPFLRRLFGTIAGPDLDDEPFAGFVDDLAQLLAVTDMEAVLADFGKHTRQEDPIVHFYETFLAQYDPKMRELRGVYYTPEPVVSYIVRSVDALLRTHFDCPEGLGDDSTVAYTYIDDQGEKRTATSPRVLLLDPACGTGTFLYYVIEHIRESYRQTGSSGMWSGYVREQLLPRLFGFELLMAPYAMAHLKLGMQLAAVDLPPAERATWAYDFQSDERLGLYLTNTLEEALKRSQIMFGRYISDEANEAARVKQGYPVMVVLGNPPYSGHSANKGKWISDLLHGKDNSGKKVANYFEVDGQSLHERNPKWLNDDYVKFIRFAQGRIEQTGYGILAFITNHGYLDNPTFRGMRQSLMQSFDDIYMLNLHGNSKKQEKAPDGTKDENVFDIQQGVAIGIFVKRQQHTTASQLANLYHADLWGAREEYEKVGHARKLVSGKYHWLAENDITTTQWTTLTPESPYYMFVPQQTNLKAEYEQGEKVTEMMPVNVLGFQTHRDHFAIDFDKNDLSRRISEMRDKHISDQAYAEKYNLTDNRDWKLAKARQVLSADALWQERFKSCLYRPFDWRFCYFSEVMMDYPRVELRQHMLKPNLSLNVTRQTKADQWRHALVANTPTPAIYAEIKDGSNVFPLYLYPNGAELPGLDEEPGVSPTGRRPNFSSAFIATITSKLAMRFTSDGQGDLHTTIGPEDIFHYMYAVFHSPAYRERYAEFLKIDFPRLPLTSNVDLFRALCGLGERLVGLHLMEKYGQAMPNFPEKGNDTVEKVEYTSSADRPGSGRVWINKTQYFDGIAPQVWEFHVGGYQVCHKWLKDRKGRALTYGDLKHYQRVVAALAETITLMEQVDASIDECGGWPIE
ncbi:MAG TPA: type ISP restriction/modification enzyme [Ktedonobacteraceae bacterium]|nr:type ISP restriction/modification enzyme [Ktedonobacteraceae bacterium]